jgi:hypothetical protein
MMGTKTRDFAPLPDDLSLEALVPKDNFYRRLEATLDLSFVRDLVRDCYASSGRASLPRSIRLGDSRIEPVSIYQTVSLGNL